MPRKEKRLIHARINRPVLVRKTLLECAILATSILKGYQTIKKIRFQKNRLKAELKNNLQISKLLLDKLEQSELPRTPELIKEKPKESKELKKEITEEVKRRKLQENLEIDTELESLQRKLRSL